MCKWSQCTKLGCVSSLSPNKWLYGFITFLWDFVEIYTKPPEATFNDLFINIYINISNLCEGARAQVLFENEHRGTWLFLMAIRYARNVFSDARQHVRAYRAFRFGFEGDLRSLRRENFSLASRVKTKSRD